MPEDELSNRKAIMHSKTTLETLEKLRHSLLMGSVSANVLNDLNRMVNSQRHLAVDPKLKEILDDIELRAAVELAKLEKASKSID
jgi:RecB family exonuclease